uniref:cytochrome c oxidase subunit III n=1 Tax=Paraschizogynium plumachela TaxID=3109024 RepID=UPI002E7857D3|nr:cytochrome c oxidase subunit III [Paraschizogynium plumachela]WQM21755.1 cytochrome c oxidase subunit III [Paraschizogynium plumachela]
MTFHPFHLVEKSPWPLVSSLAALNMTSGLISFMHNNSMLILKLALLMTLLTMIQWWRDIMREATFQGLHTIKVKQGLKWGMILFIISEILFFISFFWAFFHASLAPDTEIGAIWPPSGISTFNPFNIPLLNTTILLSSGVTITWSHHSIIEKNYNNAFLALMITILLGFYFTLLQAWEYMEAPFTISDCIYGTSFFMATGFHGLHVIIGTTFLSVNLWRMYLGHLSKNHHFSFEAAAWYWHFVDVVWLFLYIFIYWWGY